MLTRLFYRKEAVRLGLFDPDWYCKLHPDVASHGIDPFKHYIRHGWQEGRMPSPTLGEAFLRQVMPDLVNAKRNPVVEILSRIRRGVLSEDGLIDVLTSQDRIVSHATRLQPGVTVVGVFGDQGKMGEGGRIVAHLLEAAQVPCSFYNLLPANEIDEEFKSKCLSVMDRKSTIFVVDASTARWAISHLRPGRLNILLPCPSLGNQVRGWGEVTNAFDEVWYDGSVKLDEMSFLSGKSEIFKHGPFLSSAQRNGISLDLAGLGHEFTILLEARHCL